MGDRKHGPAGRLPGRVGPNAVTRTIEALRAFHGEESCRAVLICAGLERYARTPPVEMVPEGEVAALQVALVDVLGPKQAAIVASEAGRLTGGYLLENRIPRLAQALLRRLPRPLAAALLVRAIARHAWTFAGSGQFSYAWTDGLRLNLSGSPVCRDLRTGEPACHFLAATFERVFSAMLGPDTTVRETACLSAGDPACIFVVQWSGSRVPVRMETVAQAAPGLQRPAPS
jgi:divinyl protochlorophyllide a 8-vinyl-reductase